MHQKAPIFIGIFLGALYGVAMRLIWDLEFTKAHGGLVTLSFLFLVPFVIGFIRVHFELKVNRDIDYGKMARIAWQPIFAFLLVCIVTLLEGSICIAIALPIFMALSSFGGMFAGWLYRSLNKNNNGTLISVAFLPLLISPIEVNFLSLSQVYEVENHITINAPKEAVWAQLANVKSIDDDEFDSYINTFIGIPKPLEARMDGNRVGAVRTSYWQKGIVFNEIITQWQPNKVLAFDFDIDPSQIPDSALDNHVKLGGDYFSPLYGGYYISSDKAGNTVLTLKTTLKDNTSFGVYSRLWGEAIIADFHIALLKMMKSRAEQSQQISKL